MNGVVNIDDLRKLAKKRLPKIAYDFIEGGTDDEVGLATNEQAFRKARIVPRYLVDVTVRDQSTTLFGRTYSSPIGIAPTGLAGLFRRGADLMLAEAARDANVPFIMSGSEHRLDRGPRQARARPRLVPALLRQGPVDLRGHDQARRRCRPARRWSSRSTCPKAPTASATRATAGAGRSSSPGRPSSRRCMHPAWMMEWLRHGTPYFDNWAKYAPAGATPTRSPISSPTQNRAPMTWKHVERYRELWKGNFVLKGIMHPDDAIRAHSLGVDGIMVSNHGARQLDNAPSPLEVLPAIRDAVGDKMTLMFDGGIRRGLDALIALCMGAKFVFVGRPTLYGVTAGGIAGAARWRSASSAARSTSAWRRWAPPSISDLGPQFLMWKDEEDLRRNRR